MTLLGHSAACAANVRLSIVVVLWFHSWVTVLHVLPM